MVKLDPLTRKVYERGPKRGIIVLMYHSTPGQGVAPASRYSLPAGRFAEQLDFLKAAGWETALVKDLSEPSRLPDKTAIITFDDGYSNNYEGAFIPLCERGMRATWYVVSGKAGGHADWLGAKTEETAFMGTAQWRELAEHGMEIGSHTVTHAPLDQLEPPKLQDELARSKSQIEDVIGRPVLSLAYPFGRLSDPAVAAVGEAGYALACTTRSGWYRADESPLLIRRITLFSDDTVNSFARKLAFADNDVSWTKLSRYFAGRVGARFVKSGKSLG